MDTNDYFSKRKDIDIIRLDDRDKIEKDKSSKPFLQYLPICSAQYLKKCVGIFT